MIMPFILMVIIDTGVPQINNTNLPAFRNPTQIVKQVQDYQTSEACQAAALKMNSNGQLLGAFCSVKFK